MGLGSTPDVSREIDGIVRLIRIPYDECVPAASPTPPPVASVGSKGGSYDNALAEVFNSVFKAELICNKGLWTGINDLEIAVAEYID